MQKIKYIKNYLGKKIGEIEVVSNNIAHGLIERGVAVLYSAKKIITGYADKMMRPETSTTKKGKKRKGYKVK